MAQNYTRQSSFADGDTITAALFNNEFNQVVNAFAYSASSDSSTGHKHDGSSGQGGNIPQIGDIDFLNKIVVDNTNNRWGFYVQVSSGTVEQLRIQDGAIVPVTNNDIDLGTSSLEFKDLFIDGTAHIDTLDVDVNATVAGTLGVTGVLTATSLDISGDIDVDGTANLDIVDIDGAVNIAATTTVATDNKIQFRDTAIYVNSSADGQLDIVADTEVQIAATTVDINGAVDISGNLDVGGNLVVTGTTTFNGGTLTMGDAATDNVVFGADINSNIIPNTDDTYDLGSSSQEWRNLYINGTANIDSLVADTADINGGTIDGATIATSDITVGAGKTLNVSAGTLTLADNQISGDKVEGGTIAATTITTLTSTTGNITSVNATTVDTTNLEVTTLKAKDGTTAGSIADSTGIVTVASSVLTTTDINGGTIDGADITVGAAKTLDVSAGTLTLADNQISGDKVEGGTIAATTITALTFGSLNDGVVTVTAWADEDDMSSDSATLVPTQQSVKAYVDSQVTAQDLDIVGDTGTDAIDLDSETITFTGGTGITSVVTTGTVTHNIDSTVATLTGTQTLTNKSLTTPTLTGTATVASLDISGDIDVDGTTNLDVVDIDGAVDMASTLQVDGSITSSDEMTITKAVADQLTLAYNAANSTSYGYFSIVNNNIGNEFSIHTGGSKSLNLAANGDVSFYNTAGNSQSLLWDASAESLGIGTSSPSTKLQVDGLSDGGALNVASLVNTGTAANTSSRLLFIQGGNTTRGAYVGGLNESTSGQPTSLVFGTSRRLFSPNRTHAHRFQWRDRC